MNSKVIKIETAVLAILLTGMTGCTQNDTSASESENASANDLHIFQMEPLENGQDMPEALTYINSGYEDDILYEITSPELEENTDYRIFKYSQSCASYLYYEDSIYQLGEFFGGLGLTSFASADINSDGKDELYFTFSWGSGMHRAKAGYFDPIKKEPVIFSDSYFDRDWIIVKTDYETLSLYTAEMVSSHQEKTAFAKMAMRSDVYSKAATIMFQNDEIILKLNDNL
ncbi:MAG: hypothetical protein K2H01_01675 [Ruminococcus sp.]|nr:hypothetical protein [Ruminococcus sp.]